MKHLFTSIFAATATLSAAPAFADDPTVPAAAKTAMAGAAKGYYVITRIRATPTAVWALLTDAPAYPSWNPTLEKIEGTIAPGGRIKVFPKLSPGQGIGLEVAEFEPAQRMVWRGGMPLGLFKAERTFLVQPEEDGTVIFAMWEVMSGPMAGMIVGSIPDLQPSFDQFANALKQRAESSATSVR